MIKQYFPGLRGWLALFSGLTGLCLLVVWFNWFSPYGYTPPDDLPVIEERSHQVFAFGTLKSPWVRWLVMGRAGTAEQASLSGKRREGLNIVPDPEAVTEGYVFEVSARELARLDHYERLGVRYERVKMSLDDGREVWVYRRL
ncbi:MAG: gamma-glutamylcyclotransferase family protein [Nitrincola lacisaponensis]|uniref:gamma-glutamylcyclotransferase family protein n=1 Tax=Nitrincola lacisaponensis TaxID=267850 RepID=UPI00391C4DBC